MMDSRKLRIFQVIASSANQAVPHNRTWYRNLYEPLREMGHDVVLIPAEEGHRAFLANNSKARIRFSEKLLEKFHQEHTKKPFDLFFAYLMDGMVETEAIDAIRQQGVPTCNFSCNNIHQFDLVDELSPHFDFNLHAEKAAREKFLAIGSKPIWWPMASNPRYFKPQDLPRTLDVSFVGGNYALRARYLGHLLENGIDAHAFGPGWRIRLLTSLKATVDHYLLLAKALLAVSPDQRYQTAAALADHDFRYNLKVRFPHNVHGPVSDDELVALYSRSHISMGFLEVYDHHNPSSKVLQHMHLREFEAPMSGALYCTGYSEELTECFEPDKEVVVYRNQHEIVDKVRHFLTHPEEAGKIRAAGRKRALNDHTYHQRFETLFREIGLSSR